ncbi:MAG: DUF2791 family P-loop domain-containing protein [Candidatus Bathyarchaeia archaeon]
MSAKGLSIIDLSRLRVRDYPKCFLTRNPFPSAAIPEEVPIITVDREPIIRHFQDVIAHLYQYGDSVVTVLVGDYGSGKSHLLRVFKHSVNSQLLQLDEPMLAVYIKSPGRSMLDFFFNFLEDLGRPLLTDFSIKVIKEYLQRTWAKSQRHIFDREMRKKFEQGETPVEYILRASTINDLITEIKREVFASVKSQDLVSAFLFLAHPDYSSTAWRWLLGEKLSREERESILVDTSISDTKEAYLMMQSTFELLRLIGIKSLVLLVDELEKIVLIPAVQRSQYQDDLRHLIDDNPKGLGVFFAIAPAQWSMLSREPTALQRRLAGNIQLLDNFDEERIKELIRGYLSISRTEEFSKEKIKEKFPKCEVELCPFTLDSIKLISEKTKGRVSDVIMLCRKALDYFIDNIDKYEAITPELISTLAKQEGI